MPPAYLPSIRSVRLTGPLLAARWWGLLAACCLLLSAPRLMAQTPPPAADTPLLPSPVDTPPQTLAPASQNPAPQPQSGYRPTPPDTSQAADSTQDADTSQVDTLVEKGLFGRKGREQANQNTDTEIPGQEADRGKVKGDSSLSYIHGLRVTSWFAQHQTKGIFFSGFTGAIMGGRVGVFINNRFTVSLGYFRGVSDKDFDIDATYQERDTQVTANLNLWYIPLSAEIFIWQNKWLHLTAPLDVAGGIAGFSLSGPTPDGRSTEDWERDLFSNEPGRGFFLIEPGLNLDVKLLPWLRIGAGASLRIVSGWLNYDYVEPDLNGFSLHGGLRVGNFGKAREKRNNQ